MIGIEIYSNRDLLNYLESLETQTSKFFDSNERSAKGLQGTLINIRVGLEFNEVMCRKISTYFKYFKGVLDGHGNTITVSSEKTVSLFSSIYFSVIRNLVIHNVAGSRGLLLADDLSSSTVQNVRLIGSITAEESMGGFARTAQGVSFEDCMINITVKGVNNGSTVEQVGTDPIHFGGYVGVSLGNTKFTNCTASGKITSEVSVGGFCAMARDTKFNTSKVDKLRVYGKREVGLYVGKSSKELDFLDCLVKDSELSATIYAGLITGFSSGKIFATRLNVLNSFINPSSVASYVGGIAGTAEEIRLGDSVISGGVSGSFILAGVCPDVAIAEVFNNSFDLRITASGYMPMMTHAYPLVRSEFLTTAGAEISFTEHNNNTNIKVTELEREGFVNPFEEAIS